ncbi:SGNH/GDSL hydrolase family protein [Caldanaerobacter sp.]|uniref:SGNH/GDSL hydrolase family protein n=1 Tax=Caldanaerobacter sp. TaxID=2930036 RepID=UPI003C71A548
MTRESYSILLAGDSISKGVILEEKRNRYIVTDENYVNIVKEKIKGTVKNISKFGATILKGIEMVDREFKKEKPDIIVLEFGGNDCDFNWEEVAKKPGEEHFPKTGYHLFIQKLKEIIEFSRDFGVIPVLMTLPPLDADRYLKWISKMNKEMEQNILTWLGSVTKIYWWHEKYDSAIRMVAEHTNTLLIDLRTAFLHQSDFRNFLCKDGIHPNEEGHKIMASKIIEYLECHYPYILKNFKNMRGGF